MRNKNLTMLTVLAGSLLAAAAHADGGAVRVHNGTSTTVTVNYDGGYCCTADAGDTCSCVVSVGKHTLQATRHDDNHKQGYDVDVPADGYDLNLSDGNP